MTTMVPLPASLMAISGPDGAMDPQWYAFFLSLFQHTNAPSGSISSQLDTIDSNTGAMLFRAVAGWDGLTIGPFGAVLISNVSAPEWGFLSGANFSSVGQNQVLAGPISSGGVPSFRVLDISDLGGTQPANVFLAGPASGPPGDSTFRTIVSADLASTEGQFPGTATNDNALSGNIGEYIDGSATVASVTSNTPTDLESLNLTAGDWDVWGILTSLPDIGTTQSKQRAWISTTSATDPGTPNGGAYFLNQIAVPAHLQSVNPIGMMRLSLAGPTTVYLSASIAFAVSTLGATGFIAARRVR